MPLQTKAIKRRIKSVTNTRKITKAMELVAASKMRKAVSAVLHSRAYSDLAWATVRAIARKTDATTHPLLAREKTVTRALLIVLSSDRGLAGGFNGNLVRRALETLRAFKEKGIEVDAICLGRKGAAAMQKAKVNTLASFTDLTNNTRFKDVLPVGRMVIDAFTQGAYQNITLVYTDYVSAVTQTPITLELLPLGQQEDVSRIGEVGTQEAHKDKRKEQGEPGEAGFGSAEYTFEPSASEVLDRLLPRLVETMVYQAVLETAAAEHSARMLAMRNASDSAADMIDSLTLSFNQARQAGITQEIAEISAGSAALAHAV